MTKTSKLLIVGVVLPALLVACSRNVTVETIQATPTTVVGVCRPPEYLSCAGAQWQNFNLSEAKLNGADLTGANLSGADLSGAILTGAILTGATMP